MDDSTSAEEYFTDLMEAEAQPVEDVKLQYFDLVMGIWVPGVVCILGIGGNLLSLVVLSVDRSHCPTFYSLRALAMSDVILLFSAFIQQVVPMYIRDGCENFKEFCKNQNYLRIYAWPIICITQMCSIWMTVLISAERYLAVCRPLHSAHLRCYSKVRAAVFTILLVSLIFNIPRFFEFEPVKEFDPLLNETAVQIGNSPLRHHVVYRYFYNTALFCLMVYAIPLTVLLYLNIKIIIAMRQAAKSWDSLNRRQQRELKATVMPLVIVIVFIVCSTQALIAFILDAIFIESSNTRWLQIYTAIVNLLVIINSAINFLIFYLFGRKFRVLLKRVVSCHFRRTGSALVRYGWRKTPVIQLVSREEEF